MVFWIAFICLSLISTFLLYIYSTRNFSYWKKRNVFYNKPVPFFGNFLKSTTLQKPIASVLKDLYDSTLDDYLGIFSYDRPVLLLRSPKLVKDILLKDFSYFTDRMAATAESDPAVSNMMFFKKGPMWKVIRSKMTPVFSSGKLRAMFLLVSAEAEKMNDYGTKLCGVPNVEIKEVCAKFSTNVIATCAFGIDAQSFQNEDAEFRNFGRRIFRFTFLNTLRQVGGFCAPGVIKILNLQFMEEQIIESLKRIFTDVLNFRSKQTERKGSDLIDIMLDQTSNKVGAELDSNMLMGQALQFYLAGFETVSATLSFAMYEMCVNPEIQERVRKEIQKSIQENNGLTYDGLQQMKYLDMCISETLRKYPVLPFLDRVCGSNYKVNGSDFVIEKGQAVFISTFGLHYDEKHFPDPEKFIPERFEDKNTINKNGFFYVPFGEGPRSCIGNRFGLMATKIGLASTLKKYRLQRSSETPTSIRFATKGLLIQSDVGIPLQLEPI